MRYYSQIIVSPEELTSRDLIHRNILFYKSKDAFILGSVLSEDNEPIKGAFIRIRKIYTKQQITKEMGCVMTNENGEFAFIVRKQKGIQYQLDVYEPMISSLWLEDYDANQFE